MKIVSPLSARLILAIMFSVLLAGCGGDSPAAVAEEQSSSTADGSQPEPTPNQVSGNDLDREPEPDPQTTDDQPTGFFDVAEARELPARAGGWGFVHAPPFGAVEPTELPELDPFWIACRDGDGGACEDLYNLAWNEITFETSEAAWEPYYNFGATCGGRRVDRVEPCTELLPGDRTTDVEGVERVQFKPEVTPFWLSSPLEGQSFDLRHIPAATTPAPGTDTQLDPLWTDCAAGDGLACDELFDAGASFLLPDGVYSLFGATCGGRTSLIEVCAVMLASPERQVAQGSPAPGSDPTRDALFESCGAGDASACWDLRLASVLAGSDYTDEQYETNWPYWYYATTCGGQADRPIQLPGCFDYQAWPVIAEVDSLPVPPDY